MHRNRLPGSGASNRRLGGRPVAALTLLAAALAGIAARGLPSPAATSFSASREQTVGGGHSPRVATAARGRSVVAWLATYDVSGGRLLDGVLVRRFVDDAPAGEAVAVGPEGDARDARVAMSARGDFVVVWHEAAGVDAIRGQLFAPDGRRRNGWLGLSPRGAPVAHPEVAMGPDGRFVVAWERPGARPARAVRAATFEADGRRLAGPRVMDARGTVGNLLEAVSAGDRTVAVGWTEVTPCPHEPLEGLSVVSAVATFGWSLGPLEPRDRFANADPCFDGPRVLALAGSRLGPLGVFVGARYSIQRLSPLDGGRVGPRTTVAELPSCDDVSCERVAAVAGDERGRFVLVWEHMQAAGEQWDLFVELYDREGRRQSERFQVNSASSSRPQHPAAALTADGTLMVVWERDHRRGGSQVVMRRLRLP